MDGGLSYVLVGLFAVAGGGTRVLAVLAETDPSTVLISAVLGTVTGIAGVAVSGAVAIHKMRQERASQAGSLDLDRFDKSMKMLVSENERLYDEVVGLRESEGENHRRILELESAVAAAQAEARTATDSAAIANARLAEIDRREQTSHD